jgi:hypothetical protein
LRSLVRADSPWFVDFVKIMFVVEAYIVIFGSC